MTFEEVRNLKINNIISSTSTEMYQLTKQCLSIVDSSHYKDDEIQMLINAGASDLVRNGIDVENNIEDGLIQGAIVMFVKANFGMVDINEKKICEQRYIDMVKNLSLSTAYKLGGGVSD